MIKFIIGVLYGTRIDRSQNGPETTVAYSVRRRIPTLIFWYFFYRL